MTMALPFPSNKHEQMGDGLRVQLTLDLTPDNAALITALYVILETPQCEWNDVPYQSLAVADYYPWLLDELALFAQHWIAWAKREEQEIPFIVEYLSECLTQ